MSCNFLVFEFSHCHDDLWNKVCKKNQKYWFRSQGYNFFKQAPHFIVISELHHILDYLMFNHGFMTFWAFLPHINTPLPLPLCLSSLKISVYVGRVNTYYCYCFIIGPYCANITLTIQRKLMMYCGVHKKSVRRKQIPYFPTTYGTNGT